MEKINKIFCTLLSFLFITVALAQFKAQLPDKGYNYPNTNQTDESDVSLLDPKRLSINHGLSFNMASIGGQSFSYGVYSNRLQYLISNKWTLNTSLYLVKSSLPFLTNQRGRQPNTFSPYSINQSPNQIFYGVQLRYRPFDNMQLDIQFNNYPSPYLYRSTPDYFSLPRKIE